MTRERDAALAAAGILIVLVGNDGNIRAATAASTWLLGVPPAELIEMATIGGARALCMEAEIGSLEPGKRADIVLVNIRQPHLWPPAHPLQRLARFANGARRRKRFWLLLVEFADLRL